MAKYGWNFRNTLSYVTDGANETFVGEATTGNPPAIYPGTAGFGYVSSVAGVNIRNRNNTVNAKIAGAHFIASGTPSWAVDLPDGVGAYYLWVLAGDYDAGWAHQIITKDGIGGTTLNTVSGTTTNQQWIDTTNTLRTAADIAAGTFDSVIVTFTDTVAEFVLGNGSGNNTFLAHVALQYIGTSAGDPVISDIDSTATTITVSWTGLADEYRINGGTITTLPDGTSPDTITGLTVATEYNSPGLELRFDAGAWSPAEPFGTANPVTGGSEIGNTPASTGSTIGVRMDIGIKIGI